MVCSQEESVAGPVELWARGARVWSGCGQREALSMVCPHVPKDSCRCEGLVHKSTGLRAGVARPPKGRVGGDRHGGPRPLRLSAGYRGYGTAGLVPGA